ncbi:response regulator [Cellulomonas chitinilytica]|uniref:Response regulator n=1 Tax=Cellulomonas chitinilytica TaxID=398759 RepID=A0A919P3P5_9CELL|nr:response regulator [Cellulomonas chitinilytica]GIG22653.1 response regulator [Cellulomonas chitinilytica]
MIRVLVTDDSRVMRQIVIRTLRQAGYDWDVREASDGAEALEAVRADEPDVVLSDWNMPNVNGIELLNQLRAEGFQTPFGFVTSESSEEMRSTAEAAGALFLISKPFTPESFREVIEPVLA